MPGHVTALFRYPLKSGTPEECSALQLLPTGRVAGDRVLAFRFAGTDLADDAWGPKQGMLVLMNTPGLARLRVRFDDREQRLAIWLDGAVLVDERLHEQGRRRIAEAVANYALTLDENPLRDHPERLPLRLIGDGVTPRFFDANDATAPEVTLHGRGSLAALAAALDDVAFNERRFRSNIVVEGLDPWEEQTWIGGRVRVGSLEFDVPRQKPRCLATHANPETGVRDRQVLTTLTHTFGQERPSFAVAMACLNPPGLVHVGDEVTPVG